MAPHINPGAQGRPFMVTKANSARSAVPGSLGLMPFTALVVGYMIGSVIFLLPASLAAFVPISLVGWVFTSLGY